MSADKDNKEPLDNLFEAFSSELYPTKEAIKKELQDRGMDGESIGREGLSFVNKLQARMKITLAKREMLSKVAAAKEAIKALVPKLSINNKEQLAKLLFGDQATVAVNFNKLNELSDEDIISMLDEVQLLEFLDKIKNESK
jgi:hypothetical protein